MEEKDFEAAEVVEELKEVKEVEDESNIEPPTQKKNHNKEREKRKRRRIQIDSEDLVFWIISVVVVSFLYFFLTYAAEGIIPKMIYMRKARQSSVLIHRGGVPSVEYLQVIGEIEKPFNITKGKVFEQCRWVHSSKLTVLDGDTKVVHTIESRRISIQIFTWIEAFSRKTEVLVKLLPGTCQPNEPYPEEVDKGELEKDLRLGDDYHYSVRSDIGNFLILTDTKEIRYKLTNKFQFNREYCFRIFLESRP